MPYKYNPISGEMDFYESSTGATDVTSTLVIANESVVRGDGGVRGVQDSLVFITDAGVMSGATQLNVDNLRLDGNTFSSTNLNGDISLTPNGTGKINGTELTLTTALDETYGGTGNTTYTQGDIIYSSAANTLSKLAKDTNATRYLSNTGGSNNPAWAQVDVSNGVTGTLPATSGGTAQATYAAGDILYASAINTLSKLTAGSNGDVLTLAAGVPSWAAPAGGGGVVLTKYTASDTWTKDADAKWITVYIWGAGHGGGSGRRGGALSGRSGGGGGAGGGGLCYSGPAAFFNATETVTIGAGGTGGAAIAVDDTNGNPGTNGGDTSIGFILAGRSNSDGFGGGGTSTDGTAGNSTRYWNNDSVTSTSSTGATAGNDDPPANGSAMPGSLSTITAAMYMVPRGGGGGGGINAINTSSNGGNGALYNYASSSTAVSSLLAGGSGGVVGGAAAGNGLDASTLTAGGIACGGTGGGGGAGGGFGIGNVGNPFPLPRDLWELEVHLR